MINLLADSKKKEIRNGRINVIILRYITWVAITGIVLAGIVIGALVVLNTSRINAESEAKNAEAQITQYSKSKQRADTFRQDLATAKQILDKEIPYSRALLKIAASLPNGVYLDALDLDSSKFGTPTTLTFNATSQNTALLLKTKLEENSALYSDVHFDSLDLKEEGTHPVKVTVSLTINKAVLDE